MSQSYSIEPPPTAKAVLHTTAGDIEFEIFAKQTPKTARNFLQHCLNGYFNGTIFHRVVPGFIVQGGDPTGTGEGGESIYDEGPFEDEFHQRLKFNRRGLLGMANSGRKDDNGSQFFITLGKADGLDGRNTMFGRVVGDTIYNVVKMGEAELLPGEGSERPAYPTKITGATILVNPFADMVKQEVKLKPVLETAKPAPKAKKRANKQLLSFDDAEGAVVAPAVKRTKVNPKLVQEPLSQTAHKSKAESVKPAIKAQEKQVSVSAARPRTPPRQDQLPLPREETPSDDSDEPDNVKRVSSLLEKTNAQIAELKSSMKRNVVAHREETQKKISALEAMIPKTSIRGRKRGAQAKTSGKNDTAALQLLDAFRAKLEEVPEETTSEAAKAPTNGDSALVTHEEDDGDEAALCDLHFIANCQSCKSWDDADQDKDEEDENESGMAWMSHRLNFEKDRLGKDLEWKRKNEEDLVVIDPRAKARDIKMAQKSDKPRDRRMRAD